MRFAAIAIIAALQTACLAHNLAGIGASDPHLETAQVPPAESDAHLSCAEAPCNTAPIEQPYTDGRSRGVFWGVFSAELAVSIAGLVASTQSHDLVPWVPMASGGWVLAFSDLLAYIGAHDYGRQREPWRLAKPVAVDFRGQRAPIRINDILPPADAAPPAKFSVAPALQRVAALQPVAKAKGRVAVLDLKSAAKDLSADDVRYFGDLVRAATLKAAPQLEVMTRENLLVLLQAAGKDLANCEGECEVDTGRRIGADAIVSGEVMKIGSRYKLTLRLHDTHDGKLLGATVASGKSLDELDDSVAKATQELFSR